MKVKNTLLLSLTSAVLACSANAQTVIDIVGSTAGRTAVHNKILQVLTGETFAYVGGSASGATSAIYKGNIGADAYIIRTYWTGSVNGVRDVADQLSQTGLLATSTATVANPTTPVASPTYDTNPTTNTPEIGFSDVFATSTGFNGPAVQTQVAVIPFKWYRNLNGSNKVTNMTPLLVQALYGALGELPLTLWSADEADRNDIVFGVGRNSNSGTRITTLAESGFGVFNQVEQYTATISGSSAPYTVTTITPSGNNGASSGSDIKRVMQGNFSGGTLVGYLGASDWLTVGEAAQELSWNGVFYSPENLHNGTYTFWGYLHMNSVALAGAAQTFFTNLSNAISADPGTGLSSIEAMNVARDADGSIIYLKDE